MSVSALFVSDLHLNGYNTLFPEAPDPDDFVFNVLEQVMHYARNNGICNIIMPGDIFHEPEPTDEAKIKLMRFFAKYSEYHFWIIPGNHDYSYEGMLSINMLKFLSDELKLFSNVKYFDSPTHTNIDGVPFTFLPWPHHVVENENPHFVVAHIDANGAYRPNGKLIKNLKYELAKQHTWFIGHIHMYQRLKNIYYVGNILQKDFGEKPLKGFVHALFFMNGTWQCKTKFVPVYTPFELHTLIANDHDELMSLKFHEDRNKIFRYKLKYHKDIVLPPSWLARHPEIIKPEPFSSTTQLNYDREYDTTIVTTEFNIFEDFGNWLGEREVEEVVAVGSEDILKDIFKEQGITVENASMV